MAEEPTRDSDDAKKVFAEPAAAQVALGAASPEAREYLTKQATVAEKQSRLLDLQISDMEREDQVRHWGLRVRHISDVLKLGFELALAFIVVAIAIGLGATIWSATQADGLVIQSFAVPASLADKGLGGQVVANKLLDRLTVMQNATDSSRAASSFANDWTNDIKVEIPDTGISLGEVVRFLRGWLGHEMHLSGELYQTPTGIALTVRMDNDAGQTFEGKADDLDGVVARAAEAVYARAQPYRYSVYLSQANRDAESVAVLRKLIGQGPDTEKAWADVGLAIIVANKGDDQTGRAYIEAGLKVKPDLPNFYFVLSSSDTDHSHEEASLANLRRFDTLLQGNGGREWSPDQIAFGLESSQSIEAALLGDYREALAKDVPSPGNGGDLVVENIAFSSDLSMHDIAGARGTLAGIAALASSQNSVTENLDENRGQLAFALADWRGAIARFGEADAAKRESIVTSKGWSNDSLNFHSNIDPLTAYAHAMLGEFGQADAILKTLPADCDICARMHGRVEAARHNWPAAARWFALVSARSPSIPFADTDWGQMLLEKGDLEGAVAKFASANAKGPHFADPLEMWGETLVAKKRSDLALAKFAEASKYAPHWGRLHLKWGEALVWSGDWDGARKQFAIAAGLDLSATDRAELARMRAGTR